MLLPSAHPTSPPKTLAEAKDRIASIHQCVTSAETLPLQVCAGRCLAQGVVASIDIPPYNVAAMDGYAVRSADLDAEGRADLRVIGEIAAGHPSYRELGAGEAAHIYTGAVIPPGVDRIIPQEHCVRSSTHVAVRARIGGKPHIRLSGEDILSGQKVLEAGTRLGPGQISLLTALRVEHVTVRRRLRVGLLSVGDELAETGSSAKHGGIVDSNRPMLRGWLEELGCEAVDLGIISDTSGLVLQALIDAATNVDLIITSGGASIGPADYLPRLIVSRGSLEFWKLNMRPGKPAGFGDIDDCPILALPGNPFAAAAAFTLLGRFLVRRLAGTVETLPLRLPLARTITKEGGYLQVLAGKLAASDAGVTTVEPFRQQGSASLLAIGSADGLILFPEHRHQLAVGEPVEFVPF
ncbi:gephyrin-like molybdotransferase Glp [Mesorhizobium sp. SP-1A]|uniref:molybdopterin molybdotransferase MoeA n=1 Tax=Mesorhizobium sp. SP-1A TaxID=3077840 RepID=UPI0028F719FD|nr:gephyrin-like molybdotransferase Glp [Mesorhizobium sp. SP-1A]